MTAVAPTAPAHAQVVRLGAVPTQHVAGLLTRYGLTLRPVAGGQPIPGSYWGDEEAGLIGTTVYARRDTPLHSVLHEACHAICMSPRRRAQLHTDAGGDDGEENAVCYLQIVLADCFAFSSRDAACADMDAWGYTFRLGSARRWFREDADDARSWLRRHDLLDAQDRPTWRMRGSVVR